MEAKYIVTVDSIVVLVVSLVQKFTGSVTEDYFGEENSVNQGRYDKLQLLLFVYPAGFYLTLNSILDAMMM